jgi:hypothetical protein
MSVASEGQMPPQNGYSAALTMKIFLQPWNNCRWGRRKKKGPLSRPCVQKVEDSRRR